MNEYYPASQAAAAVEFWNARLTDPDAPFGKYEYAIPACMVDLARISVRKTAGGRSARVTLPEDRTDVLFTVVGALSKKDLPPVRHAELPSRQIPFITQHASIVGFHTESFERALVNLRHVAFEVHRTFEEGELQVWAPGDDTALLGPMLSSNCRYFTMGHGHDNVPFGDKIDPEGFLQRCLSDSVFHCIENDVAYLRLVDWDYVEHDPSGFRVGDIVEMGFEFVAWPVSAKARTIASSPQFSCRLVLRTLALLDETYTKV
ncbi:hypothetical protein B0H12DRAFT_1231087 [Mycena haematopus]|nr:hypothetical protein B0H12DRAFT_1241574 [Mycena haematopus]KAJ7229770.1 hypothetical protein B0H12DRAFT_1240191 [Mycena haematopus]KAJ7263271.1 hypothetical protein B0H12DRAFT_1231087 [Mycena haematopus]